MKTGGFLTPNLPIFPADWHQLLLFPDPEAQSAEATAEGSPVQSHT